MEALVEQLQMNLRQQIEQGKQKARGIKTDYAKRLSSQKVDFEATIQRNYKLIDELIAEKKTLTETCDKLVQEMRSLSEKAAARQKQMEDTYA